MEKHLIKKLAGQSMCFHQRTFLVITLLLAFLLSSCSQDNQEENPSSATLNELPQVERENLLQFDLETELSVREILAAYINQIKSDMSDLRINLQSLSTAADALLEAPSESSLQQARESWLSTHAKFEQTAVYRYLGYRITTEEESLQLFQLHYQMNQWPILAGYIDSVDGYMESGIVHDINVELTAENLRQQSGLFDITEVTLGFHVIEFLLWGEPDRPSQRISNDFEEIESLTAEQQDNGLLLNQLADNRRREMLRLTINQLAEDFEASASLWDQALSRFEAVADDIESEALLSLLLDSSSSMLTEELLVKSLYPILNNEFEASLQSPYSRASQASVAAQMRGVESLILETPAGDGTALDAILASLSSDFEGLFYQNLDASKACLILLYNTIGASDFSGSSATIEFEAVECINLITNLVDQLDQIELMLPPFEMSI